MLAFEFAAAALAFATAPQRAPAHRPAAAAHKAAPKKADHATACRQAHKGYDARTDTYLNAHGKRQRCIL